MKGRAIAIMIVSTIAVPVSAQKLAPPPAPAIGYDWNDGSSVDDRIAQGAIWPRADASAAGLADMIHDEDDVMRASAGVSAPESGRLLRTLRKVGGSYIVVPVFKLHFGRAGDRP